MPQVNDVSSASNTPAATPVNTAKLAAAAYTPSTGISNMNDLKEKAPEVYKMMMEGIAQNIISKMNEQQERLKKMMREGDEQSRGG